MVSVGYDTPNKNQLLYYIIGGNLMEKTTGIYMIENKINNKKYIGQSVNIRRRISEHKRQTKKYSKKYGGNLVHRTITKHG